MKTALLILVLPLFCRAQISSIEAHGLANIGIRSQLIDHIAASGSDYSRISNSIFFSPGLPELSRYNLSFEQRRKGRNYALGLQHFGPAHYQLSEIQIAYGMPLSKGFGLGLKLGLQHQQMVEQAPRQFTNFALHWDYSSSKWILGGAIAQNSNPDQNWRITNQFLYSATANFRIYAQLQVNTSVASQWALAMDYKVWKALRFSQGVVYSQGLDYRAGLGISLKSWGFHFVWQWQKAFGNREALSIIYKW